MDLAQKSSADAPHGAAPTRMSGRPQDDRGARPQCGHRRSRLGEFWLGVRAVLVGLAFGGLASGCGQHEKPQSAVPPNLPTSKVHAVAVVARPRLATEEIVGTVRSKLRATLEAKIAGRIEALTVVPGQTVQSGEVLARLEVREIQARLEQALAQREQAERDLKRFAALVEQNAVTRQEFDATEARARATRAAVVEAETMLSYARVTAPFAGVITRKLADVGDLAVPGRPILELEDPLALRLEADVPETLIGRVARGASMPVRIPALSRELSGTITEIAPSADPGSRTFAVKWDLPAEAGLRAGLFGRVSVPAGEYSSVQVPVSAVVTRGQLEILFVVENGRALLRLVRLGRVSEGAVEVLSGVVAGETVVTTGVAHLSDQQPVEVVRD